ANAAIFSVVDWVMLRPIPAVANPGELVYLVATTARGEHRNGFSHADYNAIRLQIGSAFSQVAGVLPFQMAGLAAQGTTSTFWVNYVSGNFFPMLGTHPALGRFIAFDPGQNAAAARELVLSYAFWQARFGGRASVIGEQVTVNGHAATVIGVAPPGFQGATP